MVGPRWWMPVKVDARAGEYTCWWIPEMVDSRDQWIASESGCPRWWISAFLDLCKIPLQNVVPAKFPLPPTRTNILLLREILRRLA